MIDLVLYLAAVLVVTYGVTASSLLIDVRFFFVHLSLQLLPFWAASKLRQLLYCPICTGTWVAFGLSFALPYELTDTMPHWLAQTLLSSGLLIAFSSWLAMSAPQAEIDFVDERVRLSLTKTEEP